MDESGGTQEDDSTDVNKQSGPPIVEIVPDGDLILDVTFNTSKETLKLYKKAASSSSVRRPAVSKPPPVLKPQVRVAYRVKLGVVRQHSGYFENLVSDTRFIEGRAVTEALKKLNLRGIKADEADVADLPWVKIVDDDEATCSANRDAAFGDLLRMLHNVQTVATSQNMHSVAVLTVMADRFDCAAPVSRYIFGRPQYFKWTPDRRFGQDIERATSAQEETVRQKILVSWLLNRPPNFHAATRELLMTGSSRWSYQQADDGVRRATWWNLQDGIESELHFRRERILSTIASVPSHFLKLYTSRTRQCRLGYDSSAACDSYQLGEMVKFLTKSRLLFLVDFSPASLDQVPDTAVQDISELLNTLKQCPSYQIDKNHTNCGLRTRMLPILQFIDVCLGQWCIGLIHQSWANDREAASWLAEAEMAERKRVDRSPFRFTRSTMGDARVHFKDALGYAGLARTMFTAPSWDWTPED